MARTFNRGFFHLSSTTRALTIILSCLIWFGIVVQGLLIESHHHTRPANIVTQRQVGSQQHEDKRLHSSMADVGDVIPFIAAWENEVGGSTRGIDRFGLADFVLLAKIDGSLEARDRRSGEELWKLKDQESSGYCVQDSSSTGGKRAIRASSSNKTAHNLAGDNKSVKWIVEPTGDGRLYYFSQSAGLQAVPLSIKQLVAQSPFFGTMGGLKMYTGSRRTLLYSIDVRSGEVLQVYGDDQPQQFPPSSKDDETDGDGNPSILLGRTEYRLAIHSQDDTLWNITYSAWGPNNMDLDLINQYRSTLDNVYVQPVSDSVVVGVDTQSKTQLWTAQDVDSTVIGVFDALVARSPSTTTKSTTSETPSYVILPQPIPPKQRDENEDSRENHHVYIQRTDQGAWYALSQENYPILVGSAPLAGWRLVRKEDNEQHNDDQRAPRVYNADELNILLRGVHDVSFDRYDLVSPRLLIDGQGSDNNGAGKYLQIDGPSRGGLPPPRSPGISSLLMKSLITTLIALTVAAAVWNKETLRDIFIKSLQHWAGTNQDMQSLEQAKGIAKAAVPVASVYAERKVVIVADEESNNKEKPQQEQAPTEAAAMPVKKPRKRGSRGGRNRGKGNKRKEEEEGKEAVVEGQPEENQGEEEAKIIITTDASSNGDNTIRNSGSSLLKVGEEVLGYGSHGTVVLKGEFGKRDVAVKRILVDFYEIASHEVKLLQESDHHENVVRYFCMEESEQFLYIALELCPSTLADIIEGSNNGNDDMKKLIEMRPDKILNQLASGLDHLHFLKIVHRDIKPQNILVAPPLKSAYRDDPNPSPRMLLSDFGLCKKLDEGQSSFRATTAQAAGTWGWRAPELLVDYKPPLEEESSKQGLFSSSLSSSEPLVMIDGNRRATRAIDIFSLGCVFYYILTMGLHPFGEDRYMREANIIRGELGINEQEFVDMKGIDKSKEAGDLIERMISHEPSERPGSKDILKHPYFWSQQKRLDFLLELSDRFEVEPREPPSKLLTLLETQVKTGVEDWYEVLDGKFVENLGRYRKYRGDKVLDLLRAMRNKKHHYQDLPNDVQEILGPLPHGFINYFTSRFPELILTGYYLVKQRLDLESCFHAFV